MDICKDECDKNQSKATNQQIKLEQNLVARVVDIKGDVVAINRADKDAQERPLSLGKPLYNYDYIHSKKDSWALLVFPDGEKLTLQSESELDIKQYNYQITGKKDEILYHLAAGGLRALSGTIAQNDHDAFALTTPVATIGIRGTETFTIVTKDPSNPSSFNINHMTLQGTSFAKVTDNTGKTTETVVPTGSSLQMTGTPTPTVPGAETQPGGTPPTVTVKQQPTVKPTPPNAPKPQGPPLIPDPAGTKALFEVKGPSVVTIVKMISGNGKVVSKNGQNSANLKPGDTGAVKPNSDLKISAPTNSTNTPTNNTNETSNNNSQPNNNPQTAPNNPTTNQQPVNPNTQSSINTQSNTNTPSTTGATTSEQQVTNVQQLIETASPN